MKPNCDRKTDMEGTIWRNLESARLNFKMGIERKVHKVVGNTHLVQDEVLNGGYC